MSRPAGGYKLNGEKIPGVTTICGQLNKPALVYWAFKLGQENPDITLREAQQGALDIGTLAHDMVECHLLGKNGPDKREYPADIFDAAFQSYQNFLVWAEQNKLEVIATEQSFISERYRYAGTLDAVVTLNGKLGVVDWKTSKGVYLEMKLQLAAYGNLLTEGGMEVQGGYHILRIDKETGAFAHHWWAELDTAFEAFKRLRDLYDLMKKV